jgi:DNA repair protein RecN (Recombination protein N)
LKKRKEILVNSERIFSSLSLCYISLYDGEERSSAYDNIGISISQMESIERYDNKFKDFSEALNDIYYKLEDIINNIRNYKESIEYDEDILLEIDSRLDLINRLKRKYGDSVNNINSFRDEISEEADKIEKSDEYIEKLETERQKCFESIIELANALTVIRKDTAKILENNIETELKYLGMVKSIFKIDITNTESILENGMDNVSFKISANPGEPPKSLIKVASGGEMSRIMLAIKTVIADIDRMPTLIFDEIDTGISGRTAQSVAEKMSLISRKHQLLCVTHLPQIAAMADTHFRIEKITNEEKTSTIVHKLSVDEQFEELSRMLGGAKVTDITREHAKEMIKLAELTKSKI